MSVNRTLEQAGLRPTLSRILVIEFFHEHADQHLYVEDVYRGLNGDAQQLSLATVHRAMSQLVNAGLLSCVALGDGRTIYELNKGQPHDHLVCTACSRIAEFFDTVIESRQQAIAGDLSFAISERHLVLFGLCADCQNRQLQTRRSDPKVALPLTVRPKRNRLSRA
ncbi:MAG TPA: Fur family transcriptional regulator [Paraburkholderia sp.]|nr:Fur family transcriptional regulator [Paraburkholderia sp.]